MRTKPDTYAVSIVHNGRRAVCEHVQARSEDEAMDKTRAVAAEHGPDYGVEWVRLFKRAA